MSADGKVSVEGVDALLALAMTPFALLLDGAVLATLWRWFVVPTLGAPALSLPAAIGLGLIVGWLNTHPDREDADPARKRLIVSRTLDNMKLALIALVFGFVVHLFMGGAA